MRTGWLAIVLVAGSSGCETVDGVVVGPDASFARGDTADTALVLEPQCADPGFCGCDFTGYDLDNSGSDETCVHDTAVVEGSVELGAVVHANATVARYAVLGEGSTLGEGSLLAQRSVVGANTVIGDGVVVARSASIGSNTLIGDESTLGRTSIIGDDVDASVGRLTMGYGSGLGSGSDVLGSNVVFGNLASVGADSTIYADVVLARGATFGDNTTLGEGVIIGPDVLGQDNVTIGAFTRIRKDVSLANDVVVGTGVRIGRGTEIREGANLGDDAVLAALVTVGTFVDVEVDAFIPRGTILPDEAGFGPVFDYAPIVVVQTQDGVSSASGSVFVEGTVQDEGTIASVTVHVDGGVPVTVPVVNGRFETTVTGIPSRSGSIMVRAVDAGGQIGWDEVRLSDCSTAGVSHIWQGSNSDWNVGSNWSAGSVPSTSSVVLVCGDASAGDVMPQLPGNVQVQGAYLDWDSEIVTNGHRLTVSSALLGGRVTGTGSVWMTGGSIRGQVPNLEIRGNVVPSGTVHVTSNLTVPMGGKLTLQEAPVRVDGAFTQSVNSSTGGINLDRPFSQLDVQGSATFTGNTNLSTSMLNQGAVHVGGNFSAPCSTSVDCLTATAGMRFVFDGELPQTANIAASGSAYNRVGSVVVSNPSTVTFTSSSFGIPTAMGTLSAINGGRISVNSFASLGTGGTSQFTGGSRLTVPSGHSISFANDVFVGDVSEVHANVLTASKQFVMEEHAVATGARIDMLSALPVTSGFYTVQNTRLLGSVVVNEDVDLRISGNLFSIPLGANTLTINDATVFVRGAYSQSISGSLAGVNLNNGDARLQIDGDATFTGNTNLSTSNINQGVITVGGNFSAPCSTSVDCLTATAGATFVFDGGSSQTVNVAASGSAYNRLGSVVVTNSAGVSFASSSFGIPTAMGTVSVTGQGSMTANSFAALGTGGTSVFSGTSSLLVPSSHSISIASDISVQDTASIDANVLTASRELVMSDTSSMTGSRVDMLTALPITSANYTVQNTRLLGSVTVNEDVDLRISGNLFSIPLGANTLTINDATVFVRGAYSQSISGSTAGVNLNDGDARLQIDGDATFTGNTNLSTSNMNQGVITVGGNFSAPCSTSVDCLTATAGATFVFDGGSSQTVNVAASGSAYNRLGSVVVTNSAGVSFTSSLFGIPTAMGTVSVTGQGSMTANSFAALGTGGTSVFSGTSSLLVPSSHSISIASDISVQDTASIDANVLTASRELVMSDTSSMTGSRVDMLTALPITSADYTVQNTRLLGSVTVDEDVDLRISGNLFSIPLGANTLTINDATVFVRGAYSQSISGSLAGVNLNNTGARLQIDGDATFTGNTNLATSNMNQGVITVGGNFSAPCSTSADCLTATAGATFVFDGGSSQTVNVASSGSAYNRLGSVVVTNSEGVSFTSSSFGIPTAMGTVSVTGQGSMTANSFAALGTGGTSVFSGTSSLLVPSGHSISIASDISVQDTASIDANVLTASRELVMSETSSMTGSRVDMLSALPVTSANYTVQNTRLLGSVTVNEDVDLRINGNLFSIPLGSNTLTIGDATVSVRGDYSQSISGSTAGVNLNHPNARLQVDENATFTGNTNLSTSNMNQGVVTVGGNFTAPCSTSSDCLTATAGTTFVFDGSGAQTVSVTAAGPAFNRLGSVRIDNTTGSVTFVTSVYMVGSAVVAGNLTNNTSRTADTNGDLTIDGGSLTNSGTFRYNGSLNIINGGSASGNSPVNY